MVCIFEQHNEKIGPNVDIEQKAGLNKAARIEQKADKIEKKSHFLYRLFILVDQHFLKQFSITTFNCIF